MNRVTADAFRDQSAALAALRQDLHRHPETAFEERRTSQIVADRLASWGITVHRGLAGTGVVGSLRGVRAGARSIGLRADMDALNLQERNAFAHASCIPGKMHACGHDGHTTMLLAAAQKLAANPDFEGTLHFIFQPAEEGFGGARVMMEEGLFERFDCDAVYGMHNMPGIAKGQFAIRPGAMMASSDTWSVVFKGSGGHGAMPERASDPTFPAAQFITAVQGIIGRDVAANDAAVLSVGHIAAGSRESPNVIPAEVSIYGTARSYSPDVRDLLERRLAAVATSIADASGCSVSCTYLRRYPALINATEQTANCIEAAIWTVGADHVSSPAPSAGAEDFAFMLKEKPGAYIWIGNGGPGEAGSENVHSPTYDFNDDILAVGAAYWCNLVQVELG